MTRIRLFRSLFCLASLVAAVGSAPAHAGCVNYDNSRYGCVQYEDPPAPPPDRSAPVDVSTGTANTPVLPPSVVGSEKKEAPPPQPEKTEEKKQEKTVRHQRH
jgi:hypothetical protein